MKYYNEKTLSPSERTVSRVFPFFLLLFPRLDRRSSEPKQVAVEPKGSPQSFLHQKVGKAHK